MELALHRAPARYHVPRSAKPRRTSGARGAHAELKHTPRHRSAALRGAPQRQKNYTAEFKLLGWSPNTVTNVRAEKLWETIARGPREANRFRNPTGFRVLSRAGPRSRASRAHRCVAHRIITIAPSHHDASRDVLKLSPSYKLHYVTFVSSGFNHLHWFTEAYVDTLSLRGLLTLLFSTLHCLDFGSAWIIFVSLVSLAICSDSLAISAPTCTDSPGRGM